MIDYASGDFTLKYILRVRGSTLPFALCWAVPSSGLAVFVHLAATQQLPFDWSINMEPLQETYVFGIAWSAYTLVLGSMLTFRYQQAYARYWEGATQLHRTRGEWFNATSNLIAFCSLDRSMKGRVERFQHQLVRLMSMLSCAALQSVADMDDNHFDVIDTTGLSDSSLRFLANRNRLQRVEVITQWIQRLVVMNMASGILPIPPPVITRFFQELSRGAVNINQVRCIRDIPLPFPFVQLTSLLLLFYSFATPLLLGALMPSGQLAALLTFLAVEALWAANFIASEIEGPFGDDLNDLPLHQMQNDFNSSLWLLLHPDSQRPPTFVFLDSHKQWMTARSSRLSRGPEENGHTYGSSECTVDEDEATKLRIAKATQLLKRGASVVFRPVGDDRVEDKAAFVGDLSAVPSMGRDSNDDCASSAGSQASYNTADAVTNGCATSAKGDSEESQPSALHWWPDEVTTPRNASLLQVYPPPPLKLPAPQWSARSTSRSEPSEMLLDHRDVGYREAELSEISRPEPSRASRGMSRDPTELEVKFCLPPSAVT